MLAMAAGQQHHPVESFILAKPGHRHLKAHGLALHGPHSPYLILNAFALQATRWQAQRQRP